MMIKMAQFNPEGMSKYQELIDEVLRGESGKYLESGKLVYERFKADRLDLLSNAEYVTEVVTKGTPLNENSDEIPNRYYFGKHLDRLLNYFERGELVDNVGLWNWLALYWMDNVIEKRMKASDNAPALRSGLDVYLLRRGSVTHAQRHYVFSAWDNYSRYQDDSKFLLLGEEGILDNASDILEQFSYGGVSHTETIKVANRLYFGSNVPEPYKGDLVRSKSSRSPRSRIPPRTNQASPRDYKQFLLHLDVTYFLPFLTAEQIYNMLPKRFDELKDGEVDQITLTPPTSPASTSLKDPNSEIYEPTYTNGEMDSDADIYTDKVNSQPTTSEIPIQEADAQNQPVFPHLDFESIVSDLEDPRHIGILRWFFDESGSIKDGRPHKLPGGATVAHPQKGVHKPEWSDYSISVSETLDGPYDDGEPVERKDGTWTYKYMFESKSGGTAFTTKGLKECYEDDIPVGVMRQVSRKPNSRYKIWGVAIIKDFDEALGYCVLEGFPRNGILPLEYLEDTGTTDTSGSDLNQSFRSAPTKQELLKKK